MASDMGGIEFPVEDVDMSLEGSHTSHTMSTAPVTPPRPNQDNPGPGTQRIIFPASQAEDDHSSKFLGNAVPNGVHEASAASRSEVPPSSSVRTAPTIDGDSINDTSQRFASIAAHDTPKANMTARDFLKGESVRTQGKAIMTTMGLVTQSSDDWVDHLAGKLGFSEITLYRWVKSKSALPHYDFLTTQKRGSKPRKDKAKGTRWLGIPETPSLEAELYTPFTELISEVLKIISKHGPERQVYDTHNKQFAHFEEHHTSPDIVPVGYSNVVTFIEVKLDGELDRVETLEQVVVYARQMFIHQPNRMFVRGILLSQNRIQLIHVDHGGIQRSSLYDIHKRPTAFLGILLITTTSGSDRRHIGLDDTIRWTFDGKGVRDTGTLRTLALDRARSLKIVGKGPMLHHRHIRGSSTICWKVEDLEAKVRTEYIVKDTWSSEGRTPEWELFKRANKKGILGVAVMAWHEECIESISQFRCKLTVGLFFNRTFSRLVMETYGMEIENFKSVTQLLRALRDALAGHGNLYGAGILHRDISNKTILLGREGAPVGNQGILIDLSVAFDYHRGGNSLINKEPLITSRFFQSCAILDFLTDMNTDEARALAPAHDYLDDLESFFFVLCFLLFGFLANGKPRATTDKAKSVIKGWDNEDPDLALARKNLLLSPACRQRELAIEAVNSSWGEACATLFQEYMDWVVKIRGEKTRLRRQNYPKFLEQRKEILRKEQKASTAADVSAAPIQGRTKKRVYLKSVYASLYLDAQKHYDELLEMFQKAVIAVETSPAAVQDAPKVTIITDPTAPSNAVEIAQVETNTGLIPLSLGAIPKRRRYDSTTENDADFKVPELPASKAIHREAAGSGDAWSMRSTGPENDDSEDPFL